MVDDLEKKALKDTLKKIIDNNNPIPHKADNDNRIGTKFREITTRLSAIYAVI